VSAAGTGNLLSGLPGGPLPEEVVEILAEGRDVRVERIVSTGQASPVGHWYDQDEDEWVAVLAGRGAIEYADGAPPDTLGPGDHVLIPARRRHRVAWTEPGRPTVWLAVFFRTA
jgi:cupin 2 domain-containing protein